MAKPPAAKITNFFTLKDTSLTKFAGEGPLQNPDGALTQLRAIERHVKHKQLGGVCGVLEEHYIDRDFIEDHSAFYAKNLSPIPNYCKRIHFFNLPVQAVRDNLEKLRGIKGAETFLRESSEFSKDHFLGFCVLKPLPGCPVGRTVLRCFPKITDGAVRDFGAIHDYKVHLYGVPLTVRGLAFQQQDLGVSACATTALWSALQKARHMDGGPAATPAQITTRASQYALPFGRPMPSEGLNLDQMCQGVQSLGFAPNVFRSEAFEVSRWVLHSAISSGISPVLVIEEPGTNVAHAVAVAGMKLRAEHLAENPNELTDELASDLLSLYVHDDRLGPYMRADIQRRVATVAGKRKDDLILTIEWPPQLTGQPNRVEDWRLSHILVPMHNKVRLSFGQLRTTAKWIVGNFQSGRIQLGLDPVRTEVAGWIEKSTQYIETQITLASLPRVVLDSLCENVMMSRYIGVIRLDTPDAGPLDVLLDTTSTERNLVCLAVVRRGGNRANTKKLTEFVSTKLRARYLG